MERLSAKYEALYELEYVILPNCVTGDVFYGLDMLHSLKELKTMCDWEDRDNKYYNEIEFNKMQVVYSSSSTLDYLLIRFPEPFDEGLANFGIVVTWFGDSRYYTLEKFQDGYYICSAIPGERHQLSKYEGAVDIEEFCKQILMSYYTLPHLTDEEIEDNYQKGRNLQAMERFSKAEYYYLKAAKYGHAEAQEALGEFYFAGRGNLEKDETKAKMWLELSAEQGNQDAIWCLNEIQKRDFRNILSADDDDDLTS